MKHLAIAAGDVTAVMRDYAANPQLNWIGGPLDGIYVVADNIKSTWEKFGKVAGPLKVSVDKLEESANKGCHRIGQRAVPGQAADQGALCLNLP